jgi:hypothetical protein
MFEVRSPRVLLRIARKKCVLSSEMCTGCREVASRGSQETQDDGGLNMGDPA